MAARPLRDLLADLVGDSEARRAYGADPAGYLAAHGHSDLPEPLLASAVVSYADTAPVEVAEALAPYVTAHGPVPEPDAEPADWFALLTSSPSPSPSEVPDDPFDEHHDTHQDWTDPGELDFGSGATLDVPEADPEPAPDADTVEHEAPDADHVPSVPDWAAETHFAPEPPIEDLEDPEEDDQLD